MFREHLNALISRELGMSVVGETDNIQDAMRLIEHCVTPARMPGHRARPALAG